MTDWPPPGIKWFYSDSATAIAHGDCREILPLLPKVDLCLADPPYEIVAKGGGIGAKRQYLHDTEGFTDCGFDYSLLESFDNWMCFGGLKQVPKLIESAGTRRWMLITWNKPNPTPLVDGNYLPDTEYIIHAWRKGGLFGNYDDKARFIVHRVQDSETDHPNEKPIRVMSKLIRSGSAVGTLIVDPFCGSGSTLIAAKLLGRRCIGIDFSERWCEQAARRLAQEVLPFHDPPAPLPITQELALT